MTPRPIRERLKDPYWNPLPSTAILVQNQAPECINSETDHQFEQPVLETSTPSCVTMCTQ